MLSPEIVRRLDRLLALHTEGFSTEEEFGEFLGDLITAENLGAVLKRVPSDLLGVVRRGIKLDNQWAADNECLRPGGSPFDPMHFWEYYRDVAAALLEPDVLARRGLMSVVCLPSFQVEWAIRLLGSEKKGCTLALSVAETQIWSQICSSQAKVPVAVRRLEAPLPAELAAVLCEVWRKMLLRVRHPTGGGIGLDGVTYHFACHGPGTQIMAGKTWSPRGQTAPGKLVALSRLLYRYVEETDTGRCELAESIRQATAWFKALA